MTIFDNAFLENLKDAIVKCNINNSLIAKLTKKAEDSKSNIEVTYDNNIDALSSNNNDIERFLYSIIPLIEKYIQNETIKKYQEQSKVTDTNVHQNTENLVENTLIISETQGKVFLPYFVTDLEEISKNNGNMPLNEIIDKKYTLPISNFKPLSISRFREAFKLARSKEKTSFKYAFDLAFELLFNYNLHPAIITASRTLDELDIYLDCLDSGETDKFECFNIKFEIPPVFIKK